MSSARKRARKRARLEGSGSRDGDGEDRDTDSYGTFGQKLPPLSKAISDILKRYPDGQIFKVNHLVEDANLSQ